MPRILLPVLALILSTLAHGQSMPSVDALKSSDTLKSVQDAAGGSLSGLLQSQLGLTEDQADGSIGSLLELAGEKLSAGDFDKFAGMIPGADKYLETAKSLGALAGPLTSVSDLNESLSSLGISQETIQRYVPMITDYVGKLGGDEAKALLQQVLS